MGTIEKGSTAVTEHYLAFGKSVDFHSFWMSETFLIPIALFCILSSMIRSYVRSFFRNILRRRMDKLRKMRENRRDRFERNEGNQLPLPIFPLPSRLVTRATDPSTA